MHAHLRITSGHPAGRPLRPTAVASLKHQCLDLGVFCLHSQTSCAVLKHCSSVLTLLRGHEAVPGTR